MEVLKNWGINRLLLDNNEFPFHRISNRKIDIKIFFSSGTAVLHKNKNKFNSNSGVFNGYSND